MAIDECLLESAADGETTLRIYAWSEPTLSLGYFQAADERLGFPEFEPLAVVRRASGGGAILHHHELTYSFATKRVARTRSEELYLDFHETLIEVLNTLGVSVQCFQETGDDDAPVKAPFLCFRRRSPFDLVAGPHKLLGSAQRKSKSALLQHGSLLLHASPFTPLLPGVSDLADRELAVGELLDLWRPRLEYRLELSFREGQLTDTERDRSATISTGKFASPDWLNKR